MKEDGLSRSECTFQLSSHEPVAFAAHITLEAYCGRCRKTFGKWRICDPCVSILGGLNQYWHCPECGRTAPWTTFAKAERDRLS